MPQELSSIEDVTKDLLNRTVEVRRKAGTETIKYKFRTISKLYTLKVPQDESPKVQELIENSGLGIEIIDL